MLVARHKTILMGLTRSLSTLTGSDPTFSIDELAKKKKKYPTDKAIVGWDSHGRIPPREAHPILLGDCCYQLCVKKNHGSPTRHNKSFSCAMYNVPSRHAAWLGSSRILCFRFTCPTCVRAYLRMYINVISCVHDMWNM